MADSKQPESPFLDSADVSSAPVTMEPILSSPMDLATRSETPVAPTDTTTGAAVVIPTISPSPTTKKKDAESTRLATERMLAPDGAGRRLSFWRAALGVCLVLLVALGAYWWWTRPEAPIAVAEPVVSAPIVAPLATVEETPILTDDTASYRSENFKAGEVILLGEAEFLQTDEGITPLTLEGIRGEAFTEKNKQEVKLVITWNTNKLAQAEVSYAKGIGQAPTVVPTDDFAYDHSLILTGLDPASTYLYTIRVTDRFGNTAMSEPYAVFTGARSVSLFDLIAGAIGEVFGWAVK